VLDDVPKLLDPGVEGGFRRSRAADAVEARETRRLKPLGSRVALLVELLSGWSPTKVSGRSTEVACSNRRARSTIRTG